MKDFRWSIFHLHSIVPSISLLLNTKDNYLQKQYECACEMLALKKIDKWIPPAMFTMYIREGNSSKAVSFCNLSRQRKDVNSTIGKSHVYNYIFQEQQIWKYVFGLWCIAQTGFLWSSYELWKIEKNADATVKNADSTLWKSSWFAHCQHLHI